MLKSLFSFLFFSPLWQREREEDQKDKILQVAEGNIHDVNKKRESFLPPEIIIDILSRIPGSSLVTFKRVCKLWYSLITDCSLITSHLEHASRVNPPRIIIFSREEKHGQQKYHLTLLDEAWETKYRLTRASDPVLTTPPCNGLICLYDYHRNITLCNPTTQQFLPLPRPTLDSRGVINAFPKCSFGFHPLTKKYKVVRFFYLRVDHKTSTYVLGCEVFTLGSSDSWRYIGNIHSYVTDSGINVNGSIYWTTCALSYIPDEIIALDLKTEKFGAINPPDVLGYDIEVDSSMFLTRLEGNLCLVNSPSGASAAMDIWMLKGATNIWIHRFRIPLNLITGNRQLTAEPLFIYKGKILIRHGGCLYYHDQEGERLRDEKVYGDELLGNSVKFYAFVESLVPL